MGNLGATKMSFPIFAVFGAKTSEKQPVLSLFACPPPLFFSVLFMSHASGLPANPIGAPSVPLPQEAVEDKTSPVNINERRKPGEYLSWDDYFMAVAFLSAQRSKDPSTQVGAVIVNGSNKIVGIGYNGMPSGVDDADLPWARTADSPLDTKYPYVVHAELNAVLNRNSAAPVDGPSSSLRIYVSLFPCNECAKVLIQSGVKEVIFHSDKYHDVDKFVASRRLLDLASVTYRQHVPKSKTMTITFPESV